MSRKRDLSSEKLNRRRLLQFAGAGAVGAALGVHRGPLSPEAAQPVVLAQEEEDEFEWDEEFDVVVVGSGAAAGAAATTANEQGASVVILEKMGTYGGTTGKSGGTSWVPNNSQMVEAGYEDPKPDALRYMARLAFPHLYNPNGETLGIPQLNYDLLESFYDHASEAFDYLQDIGAVEHVMQDPTRPDYFAHLPEDAAPYGREMRPLTPDGDEGNGGELIRQLRSAADERDIPVRLEHRVERLVQNEDGRVVGVEVTNGDGERLAIGANQGVIFATGGFTHNVEMRNNFLRGPIYGGCAVPGAEGDFVNIAGAVGAALGNMQHAWWWQIVLEQSLAMDAVPSGISQLRGDSMIQVNRFGHRVVNEKMIYNERTQVHFNWDPIRAEYTNLLLFKLYDQRTADEFAGSYPIPSEPLGEDYVITGDTLDELAANLQERLSDLAGHTGGVSLDENFISNLHGTIAAFNQYALDGIDRQFHRGETPIEESFHGEARHNEYPNAMMYPMDDEGPYYCIILVAGTLDTKGGPVADSQARILNTFGEPIPGLFGAGNCVASPAGQAYWGAGGTLGVALTFGYLAGLSATAVLDLEDEEEPEPDDDEEPDDEDVDDDDDDDEPEPDDDEDPDDDDEEVAEPQEHVVEAGDNYFEPQELTIAAGDTVRFVNVGQMVHTATCDPDRAFDEDNVALPDGAETWDSGMFDPGEEWSVTLTVPGEYRYICIPHEVAGMVGSITVE